MGSLVYFSNVSNWFPKIDPDCGVVRDVAKKQMKIAPKGDSCKNFGKY